ncbi:competence protein CoiA [Virgibacillus salinus]|uniref:Competence protein CoiA-like family, contains a predicted nuclease domain n=1 Tax=Virgibacillus salinus TaxID=553311 RepID=A0A1H1EJB9_9BACI|nr:competence protein CoiA family protein [Virgibacillus salinus]SDQ88827.1 Competence protein CoiA-like family, contains a predicted nuclease domain [Virgibacillus salinus]
MLQAKTKYGTVVTPATLSKSEIKVLKEREEFSCPTCNEPVMMKAGTQMIPHFAHHSKNNCPSSEGGEGAYHERGKMLLYQWLKHQQLTVQLEAYLPAIRQRPDILISINNKLVAIEYQCARVPVEQIRERNEGYLSVGITPIWILGANRLTQHNRNHLKIDQFQLQFIHQFSSVLPLMLFYFCPNSLQFISFKDFYFSKTQTAIGKFHTKKLNQMSFKDMFQANFYSKNELFHSWKREKRSFRLKKANRLYGRELNWHEWIYLKRTHKEFLPSIIHLPICTQFMMKTPPWDWQSRICLEVIDPLPIESHVSIKSCQYLLRRHIHHPKEFPLIKQAVNPVHQYLQLLEQLDVIQQVSPNYFAKKNPIKFHKNIEQALAGDEKLLNLLITNKLRA